MQALSQFKGYCRQLTWVLLRGAGVHALWHVGAARAWWLAVVGLRCLHAGQAPVLGVAPGSCSR